MSYKFLFFLSLFFFFSCDSSKKATADTTTTTSTAASEKPVIKECFDINQPDDAPWMEALMKVHKVNKITKSTFRDGWAYLFNTSERRLLYDCQGTDLCPVEKGNEVECMKQYKSLMTDRTVIYSNIADR